MDKFERAIKRQEGHIEICDIRIRCGHGNPEIEQMKQDCELAIVAIPEMRGRENKPLTLDELRGVEQSGEGIYVCTTDGTPIFRGNCFTAAVLDKTQAFGALGGWNLQAIYGRGLTLAEGDYGKTWIAYRHKPEEAQG